MSQQVASFLDNDGHKGKHIKDSLRFVYKTKASHESIVFSLNSDQNKMNVKIENNTNEG